MAKIQCVLSHYCTSFHETIYKGTNTCDFWLLKVGQLGVGGGEPCSDCYACFPKSSSFRFVFSFLQFQFHHHIINTIIPEGKGQEKELWLLTYCNNLESYLDCRAIFTFSLGLYWLDQGTLSMSDPLVLEPNSVSTINCPLSNFCFRIYWSVVPYQVYQSQWSPLIVNSQ